LLRCKNIDNLLNKAWGKNLDYEGNLTKNIIDLFESMVLMCLAKFKKLESEDIVEQLKPIKMSK